MAFTGEGLLRCIEKRPHDVKLGEGQWTVEHRDIYSKNDLKATLDNDFIVSPGDGSCTWGVIDHGAKNVWDCISSSKHTFAIVCQITCRFGSVGITDPAAVELNKHAKDLYKKDYSEFCSRYGDGFVAKVGLGEKMHYVCYANARDYSGYDKSKVMAALRVKYLNVVEGNIDEGELKKADAFLAGFDVKNAVLCTGKGYMLPFNVSDKKTFDAVFADFKEMAIKNSKDNESSAILHYLFPYSLVMEGSLGDEIKQNIKFMSAWNDLRSKIMDVEAYYFDSSSMVKECKSAIAFINGEIKKCAMRQPDARGPRVDEYWTLQVKYGEISGKSLLVPVWKMGNLAANG